jgi:hypothetical protein
VEQDDASAALAAAVLSMSFAMPAVVQAIPGLKGGDYFGRFADHWAIGMTATRVDYIDYLAANAASRWIGKS